MIFESLYLLFKADTKDLKKNTKEAQGYTDQLKKSFQGMSDASGILDESFLKLTSSIGGLITAGLSVYGVFEGFKSALDIGSSLSFASRELGVNVTELQKWGGAVAHYGGNADTFSKSIKNLAENFGISYDNAVKLLGYLEPTFSRLNKVQQFQLGSNYGLDPSLIQLLGSGNARFRELMGIQSQLRPLTEENANAFLKFNDSLVTAKQAAQSLFTQVLIKALPSLTRFLDTFSEIAIKVLNNDGALEGAFKGLAVSIGILAGAFLLLNPSLLIIGGLVAGLTALSASFASFEGSEEYFKGLKDIIDAIAWGIEKIENAMERFSNFEKDKAGGSGNLAQGAYDQLRSLNKFSNPYLDTQQFAIQRGYQDLSSSNAYNFTSGDVTINASSGSLEDADAIANAMNRHVRGQFQIFKHAMNNVTTSTL